MCTAVTKSWEDAASRRASRNSASANESTPIQVKSVHKGGNLICHRPAAISAELCAVHNLSEYELVEAFLFLHGFAEPFVYN